MWPRWNTRSIVVQSFPALPAEVVPGPPVASNAPLIRTRDAVSPPPRGRFAVSDATLAELLWVHPRSVAAGVRPRERPPPAHQAPSEASLVRHAVHGSNPAQIARSPVRVWAPRPAARSGLIDDGLVYSHSWKLVTLSV